jgi:hypothetical protein
MDSSLQFIPANKFAKMVRFLEDAMTTAETSIKRGRGRPPGKYGKYRPRSPPNKLSGATDEADEINSKANPIKVPREANGTWGKGQSGNPVGVSKGAVCLFGNLAHEARKYAGIALDSLVDLVKTAESESVRLNAANSLLDRGFGRPMQSIDLKTDGPQVQVNLFQDFSTDEQRLAAETLAAINANPAALSLALDVMNDPAAMTGTIPDDIIIDLEAEPVDDSGEVLDLKPEPVE